MFKSMNRKKRTVLGGAGSRAYQIDKVEEKSAFVLESLVLDLKTRVHTRVKSSSTSPL